MVLGRKRTADVEYRVPWVSNAWSTVHRQEIIKDFLHMLHLNEAVDHLTKMSNVCCGGKMVIS